jgi:hypothetical protein
VEQVQLEFSVVPDHPRALTEPVVALGDFESQHAGAVVYDGKQASAVSALWGDLILGRPLATRLVLRQVEDIEHLVCLALFMDRELALDHKVPALISSVELVKALNAAGLAHVEPDLARFLVFLDRHVFGSKANRKELSKRLQQALTWIREYVLEGRLPSMPRPPDPPKILDTGTNGFVLAEAPLGRFFEALVDVYRLGHLRGVLFGPEKEGARGALAFKKSRFLQFDLEKACAKLNKLEASAGEPATWEIDGPRRLYLKNEATRMPPELITQVFLRV